MDTADTQVLVALADILATQAFLVRRDRVRQVIVAILVLVASAVIVDIAA